MKSRDETTLAVPAGPLWFKVTGMLQQNWCTVVNQHDGKAEAVFFDDLSSVFDRLLFESRDDCERALRFNGFAPLDEDPGFREIAGEPSFPLRESARSHCPVYSSGEYWHVPPEEFVRRPARRRVREGLERFVKAQEQVFDVALSELRSGQKSTHWMWFIFPQIRGLGTSGMSRKFGIDSLDEARDYLDHALLGTRLMDCMSVLWALEGSSARDIFGSVDALKLRSCLTLFAKASASQLRSRMMSTSSPGQRCLRGPASHPRDAMTTLHSHAAHGATPPAALQALDQQLQADPGATRLLFCFYGCDHDDALIHRYLQDRFPAAALIGGTSAGGLMTGRGVHGADAIGLLCIEDGAGDYGVAAGSLGDDPAACAQRLLNEALAQAGTPGELPELVWIYQAPGREEQVLEGLRRVVGDRCPIIGGSSADNDVSGRWRQLGPQGPLTDGLVVAVMFPSTALGFAFQGGYEPAGPSGIVTGIGMEPAGASGIVTATAGREILSIDDQPAAQVYNRWTGGSVAAQLDGGGNVLAATTMCPLATDAGRVDGVSHFLLVHPEAVTAGGALRTFCDLQVGDRVYAMRGNHRQLVERAGRVVEQARQALPDPAAPMAGVLMVYCGGCKLAVGAQIHQVAGAVSASVGTAPWIGCFTYGEQGRVIESNVHGNLMISAVVFAR